MLSIIILCVAAYLIGSVSSAVIVCRIGGLPDPREEGSKNPGATNVMRLGGKKLAAITLFCDMLKGIIPVSLALALDPRPLVVGPVMIAVFLGHLYPIFFNFKGGKGVATGLGALLALSWPLGFLLMGTWIAVAYFFRISSLAALVTTLVTPLYVCLLVDKYYLPYVGVMCLLLIWRHRVNIQRLCNKTEPKISGV